MTSRTRQARTGTLGSDIDIELLPLEEHGPDTLTHKDIGPLLAKLQQEPEFQPGPARVNHRGWYRRQVWLEFPLGELAKDGLQTLALCGRRKPEVVPITKQDRFDAQGLEGKVRVRKDLFGALMAMRDLLGEHRGQIVQAESWQPSPVWPRR